MLEKYLSEGGIYIGPLGEYQISVVFLNRDRQKISIVSQKGIRHALEALEAKISLDEQQSTEVELRYPYLLSWNTRTSIDSLVEKTCFYIYSDSGVVCVQAKQIHSNSKDIIPGVCQHTSRGSFILEILEEIARYPDFRRESLL